MEWFTCNRQGSLCSSIIWLMIKQRCVLWMPSSRRTLVPATSHVWAPERVGLGELAFISLHPGLQLSQITMYAI